MDKKFKDSWKYIMDNMERGLQKCDKNNIDAVTKRITEAEKVFVYGAGRSGLVGRTFAMRLMQIGLTAYFIGETITPAVEDEDCVIFISRTGETQSAIQAAKVVSERVEGAKIIVVTSSPGSTLASYGDEVLELEVKRGEKDKDLAPLGTVFEDTAVVFLDAFIAKLMDELGETEEGMKYRHPILV